MKIAKTLQEIETTITENNLSLLYISRESCSVCHALLPQIQELLLQFPRIFPLAVSADEVPEIAGKYSVFTVPVLIVFYDGKEMFRKARFIPIEQLKDDLLKLITSIDEN